jgi:type I restriction enzyme S subunit
MMPDGEQTSAAAGWNARPLGELAQRSVASINPSSSPEVSFAHFSLPAFDATASPVIETGAAIGSNKLVVPSEAVLVSKLNPRIPRIWAPDNVPANAVCSTEFLVLIPCADVDRRFLKYVCLSPRVCAQMQLHAIGTTGSHQRIQPRQALAIEVYVPIDRSEQRAIATALSDVDSLLAGIDRLIAKRRDLKQAVMQQLLTGRTRLPGFEGEWEVKRLGELLAYEQPTEYLVRSSDYNDANSVPVLTAGKTFILGYTDEKHGIVADLPVVIFDDFTTATKYVTFPFKVKSSAMKLLRPRGGDVDLKFVYEIMQLVEFKLSEHKRHWISEFQHLEVLMPSVEERAAITAVLSDMDAELAALEARRDKTLDLKLGMMQELLTGRTRLV